MWLEPTRQSLHDNPMIQKSVIFVVPPPGSGYQPSADTLRDLAAGIRRIQQEGLLVSAPDTPPEAFGGRPPPPLSVIPAGVVRATAHVPYSDLHVHDLFGGILSVAPSTIEDTAPDPDDPEDLDVMSVDSSHSSPAGVQTTRSSRNKGSSSSFSSSSSSDSSSFLQIAVNKIGPRSSLHSQPVRAIPTPCRALCNSTVHLTVVGETTPQAVANRNVSSQAQAGTAESIVRVSDSEPAPSTVDLPISCEERTTPKPIRLADCLPQTGHLPTAPIAVPATVEVFYEIISPLAPTAYRAAFFDLPDVHTQTRRALESMPTWDWRDSPEKADLYVDGSFFEDKQTAGWAVVLLVTHRQQTFWGGFISGLLHSEQHPLHIGQIGCNAHTAELVAMLYAMATALNLEGINCCLHFDAQAAASIAKGEASSADQHAICRGLLSLHHLCLLQCSAINFTYVAAHQGDAWNEAADTAAKAAAAGIFCQQPESEFFARAVRDGQLDWLWWPLTPMCHEGRIPALDESGLTMANTTGISARRHACQSVPGIPKLVAQERTKPSALADWHLKVATYNCTTLKKEVDRQMLSRNFAADNIHAIGLQETRTDPGVRYSQEQFCCICSPADGGQLGCQLWLNLRASLATDAQGRPVHFCQKSVAVIIRKPRLLVSTVTAGCQLFAFFVGHAPISASPHSEKEQWWGQLEAACRQIPRRALPIWLIDANAHFEGSDGESARQANCIEDNARMMQALMAEQGLESNRLHTDTGQALYSWQSPVGKRHLLDYVLFPEEFGAAAHTIGHPPCFVDPLGFDHSPILVSLCWRDLAKSNNASWSWDRKAMRTEEGKQRLRAVMTSCPPVPWSLHPDDHLQVINDHIFAGLCAHFPLPPKQSRKKHVSAEQWQAVRLRRHARRLIFRQRQRQHAHWLFALFQTWRGACSKSGDVDTQGIERAQKVCDRISQATCIGPGSTRQSYPHRQSLC